MNFDFTAYMRQIATKLKEIQHVEGDVKKTRFYRVASLDTLDEMLQKINEAGRFNILVEDNAEGALVQGNALHDKQICSFFVFQKADLNNAADRERVKKECKTVMIKILSKIYADHLTDNNQPATNQIGLRNADFNSWQYNSFGPVLNNYYGVHTAFSVLNSINVKYNPNDWIG